MSNGILEGVVTMANIQNMSFRDIDHKFLIVKNIDLRTRVIIEKSDFKIRKDDNAMLVYGYIDKDAGLSFELLCAAYVYDDGSIALEPPNNTTSFKFRYDSYNWDVEQLNDRKLLAPYEERAKDIDKWYKCSDDTMAFRSIEEIDHLRAPGYPDDIIVLFHMDGYRNEGIWCRIHKFDLENRLIKMKMLNEPNAPFGKHHGDQVDVELINVEGEIHAVAKL